MKIICNKTIFSNRRRNSKSMINKSDESQGTTILQVFFEAIDISRWCSSNNTLQTELSYMVPRARCNLWFHPIHIYYGRVLLCNGYRLRKRTQWLEFKYWIRGFAFPIGQIPLGKVWILQYSLPPWVNGREDCTF